MFYLQNWWHFWLKFGKVFFVVFHLYFGILIWIILLSEKETHNHYFILLKQLTQLTPTTQVMWVESSGQRKSRSSQNTAWRHQMQSGAAGAAAAASSGASSSSNSSIATVVQAAALAQCWNNYNNYQAAFLKVPPHPPPPSHSDTCNGCELCSLNM